MKKLLAGTGVALLVAASQVQAWTMYYDGFAYEPYSDAGHLLGTQIGYELGDPIRHRTDPFSSWTCGNPEPATWCSTQPLVCAQYPPSPWAGANNNTAWGPPGGGSGYWPYIINNNLNPPAPMPAATGHAVMCNGTASNGGKVSRVSPINLNQSPPIGPFRTITRGKLYYSLMVWVVEAPTTPTPGNGGFHAGFNNQPPEACLCTDSGACTMQTAAARLLLRCAQGDEGATNAFNIGIQGHGTPTSGAPPVWVGADTNPPYGTIYPGGLDTANALFVVVSYDMKNNTGSNPINTDDVSSIWVNPDPQTFGNNALEPAPSATSTGGDIPELSVRSFFLREGSSRAATTGYQATRIGFDELRIGTSWADVTSDVPCSPPTVAGIAPDAGAPGQQLVGVQVTGNHFVQGVTQVWLRTTGQPDIQGNNVDVTDPQHLTCNFNIPANAVNGARDVVVITCPESPGTLAGAFEIGACAPPADFNCDGFVDGFDVNEFVNCASRDRVPVQPGCEDMDLDGDGDADVRDFAKVQVCYNPGVAADPNCGN